MANNNPRPDASMPAEVVGYIADKFDIHTRGDVEFKSNAVEYEVTAWDEADPRAENVSDISQIMDDAGYTVTQMKMTEETGNLRIKGEATVEI
jgi:hypothetical protein